MTRGGIRYDGSPSRFDHGFIGRLAVDSPHDRGALDQINRDRSSNGSIIGRRRQHVEELLIAARSSRDRGAIELQTHFFHCTTVSNRSASDRRRVQTTIMARSRPDCGAIVALSWRKSRLLGSQIEAKFPPVRRGIEATIYAHRIAPSTLSKRLHDRLHHPRFQAQFPL